LLCWVRPGKASRKGMRQLPPRARIFVLGTIVLGAAVTAAIPFLPGGLPSITLSLVIYLAAALLAQLVGVRVVVAGLGGRQPGAGRACIPRGPAGSRPCIGTPPPSRPAGPSTCSTTCRPQQYSPSPRIGHSSRSAFSLAGPSSARWRCPGCA